MVTSSMAALSLPKASVDPALLHNGVCGVAGFDFSVHGKVPADDRAIPDVVVAFSVPDKGASVLR